MAVDKFFSLEVLTFTTHHKQLFAMRYVLYPLHRNAKIWECCTPKHPTCLRPCHGWLNKSVLPAPGHMKTRLTQLSWAVASLIDAKTAKCLELTQPCCLHVGHLRKRSILNNLSWKSFFFFSSWLPFSTLQKKQVFKQKASVYNLCVCLNNCIPLKQFT